MIKEDKRETVGKTDGQIINKILQYLISSSFYSPLTMSLKMS